VAFGVFIHRSDSMYDDSLAERYQFPSQYLSRVEACVGNWIIYYEPVKVVDSRGYFAAAKIREVVGDPRAAQMYIAVIEPDSYLDFASFVPFNGPWGLTETGLLNEDGKVSGRAQSAVRPLSPRDFNRIVELGLDEGVSLLPRVGSAPPYPGLSDEQAPFQHVQERGRAALASRLIRDRVFRRVVLRAYDSRCAVTGFKLINGGGRAEVEAAHIKPVEAKGPDIVSNGLALSGTAHWMFDRGLISIADDMRILVSRHVNDPDSVASMINRTGVIWRLVVTWSARTRIF
jgi:putative restriction endonuclease